MNVFLFFGFVVSEGLLVVYGFQVYSSPVDVSDPCSFGYVEVCDGEFVRVLGCENVSVGGNESFVFMLSNPPVEYVRENVCFNQSFVLK